MDYDAKKSDNMLEQPTHGTCEAKGKSPDSDPATDTLKRRCNKDPLGNLHLKLRKWKKCVVIVYQKNNGL